MVSGNIKRSLGAAILVFAWLLPCAFLLGYGAPYLSSCFLRPSHLSSEAHCRTMLAACPTDGWYSDIELLLTSQLSMSIRSLRSCSQASVLDRSIFFSEQSQVCVGPSTHQDLALSKYGAYDQRSWDKGGSRHSQCAFSSYSFSWYSHLNISALQTVYDCGYHP